MSLKNLIINSLFLVVLLAAFSSCEKNDDTTDEMETKTYTYDFNTGQLDPSYAYSGTHPNTLKAELKLEEMEDDKTKITVTLMNPQAGETYAVHAHDKMDPATNNGLPYNQTPNSDIYAQMIPAADGSMSFTSDMSFEKLTTEYEGFFVVHDPLQQINTADPTTYVVLGTFAR